MSTLKGMSANLKDTYGFTMLEVMISLAIIATVLVAVFGSQSQSISFANEAKFDTNACLLAQGMMSEVEKTNPQDLESGYGDFGEDFSGYRWEQTVEDPGFSVSKGLSGRLVRIDLTIYYGNNGEYQYRLRNYRFLPSNE